MRVPIVTSYDGRGVRQAEKGFGSLISRSIAAKLSIAAVGATLVKLGRDAVTAAMADEKAQAALNRTLANAGFGNAATGVAKYVDELQRATGVADDQLRPAFTSLFNATQDIAASQLLLEQAMSVSLGTGKDLATVTSAYSKALAGQRKGLISLGSGLDAAWIKSADLLDVFAALDQRFAGQTAANLDTVAGKVSLLEIAAGEASETIGVALIDAFSQLAGNGDITSATSNIDSLASAIAGFIRQASGVERPTNWLTAFINEIGSAAGRNLALIGKLPEIMAKGSNASRNIANIAKVLATPSTGIGMTDREKAARQASKEIDKYFSKVKAAQRLKDIADAKEKARLAAEEAARKKAAAERAKADKAKIKAAEKELRLKKLAAKFDLDLIGIAAAKKRTSNATDLARLNALDVLAQDAAGLPVSDAALAAAEKGMTNNITVNVAGSVVAENELARTLAEQLWNLNTRQGGYVGSIGKRAQMDRMP